jgi:hypothetical protein
LLIIVLLWKISHEETKKNEERTEESLRALRFFAADFHSFTASYRDMPNSCGTSVLSPAFRRRRSQFTKWITFEPRRLKAEPKT